MGRQGKRNKGRNFRKDKQALGDEQTVEQRPEAEEALDLGEEASASKGENEAPPAEDRQISDDAFTNTVEEARSVEDQKAKEAKPSPKRALREEDDLAFAFDVFENEDLPAFSKHPRTARHQEAEPEQLPPQASSPTKPLRAARPVSSTRRSSARPKAPVAYPKASLKLGPRQALTGLLAVLLLSLSIPALVTNLFLLPGNETREALNTGRAVDDEALSAFYVSRLRVHSFHATNEIFGDLAMATAESARRVGFATPTGKNLLQEALGWQTRALQASPADGFGWSRYLYLASLVEGLQSPKLPAALTFEIETAPYEPSLLGRRLGMEMTLFDKLDPELKKTVPSLMRKAWMLDPATVEAAAKAGNYYEQLLAALRASSETADLLKRWRGL